MDERRISLRILDLFCGAGGASMGLHRAFPEAEIVGIDWKAQPRYPFKFILGDVIQLEASYIYLRFDFVWASPPCQRYSCVTPKSHRHLHPNLIDSTRGLLICAGKSYVIENVVGARSALRNPKLLCGSMFGLHTRRHRLFESDFYFKAPAKCDHSKKVLLVTTAGANSRKNGNFKSVKNAQLAYGIDWMIGNELKEAIPPVYSEYIGRQWAALRSQGQEEGKTP
jgi:DNA (cytosine-5)-methyltransferase 1